MRARSSTNSMALPDFLGELDKRVLVCDGAMGTMLYGRGIFLNRSFDELNLTQPDLVAGGVDLFVLETFRDVNEIGAAVRAVRSVCALPIVAQMTTEEDGHSLDGVAPETFVPDLERRGADVVGLNCSVGPAAMLETLERMARV